MVSTSELYSRPTPEDSAIAIRALLNSVDVTKDVHNKSNRTYVYS